MFSGTAAASCADSESPGATCSVGPKNVSPKVPTSYLKTWFVSRTQLRSRDLPWTLVRSGPPCTEGEGVAPGWGGRSFQREGAVSVIALETPPGWHRQPLWPLLGTALLLGGHAGTCTLVLL